MLSEEEQLWFDKFENSVKDFVSDEFFISSGGHIEDTDNEEHADEHKLWLVLNHSIEGIQSNINYIKKVKENFVKLHAVEERKEISQKYVKLMKDFYDTIEELPKEMEDHYTSDDLKKARDLLFELASTLDKIDSVINSKPVMNNKETPFTRYRKYDGMKAPF